MRLNATYQLSVDTQRLQAAYMRGPCVFSDSLWEVPVSASLDTVRAQAAIPPIAAQECNGAVAMPHPFVEEPPSNVTRQRALMPTTDREKLASTEERRRRAEWAEGDARRALEATVDANR